MKKLFKILAWVLGIITVLIVALIIFGPGFYARMVAPEHEFGSKPLPDAPDYTLRAHWAAWPDDDSPAETLPTGIERIPEEDRAASAFFLHPTTYGGKDHWVQPMDDADAIRGTDRGTISRQASAFNACCRVYAPRFRQSNIMGYQEEGVEEQIFSIGFEDIRRAFHHFLDEIGPDEPIVLGSHSQGTFHLIRLIDEEIDGTPLMNRLVAAYAIGHSLPSSLIDEGYEDIEVCSSPTQTGCFIHWDAHEGDKSPSMWSDKEEQVLWNGKDYTGFSSSGRICVNPITWRADGVPSDKEDHLGALPRWKKGTEAGAPLGDLVAGTVSARCGGDDERNWLFVNGDRDEELKAQGIWALFSRNLHGNDYSLFWANIRQNAKDRVQAFLESGPVGAAAKRPNVVVIFADDVGYCDTELYGCDAVPTPNIRRLAEAGTVFSAGYVTSPVCSPSRAGLMTGRYQQRFGHEFLPEGDPDGKAGLPVAESTLADAMRNAGYVTGMVGKWHLGAEPEHHPINRGFDEFYGMVTWGADYADPTREDMRVWTHPLAAARDPDDAWEGRGANTLMRGTSPVDEERYLTDAFSHEAVAFIENNRDRPFFLYLPYTAIHGPLQVSQKYYDRFPEIEDESKRIYAAMTSALDDGIGRVVDAIADNGLEENTIVLFLSDNGAGVADYTNNAPLRLGKHTLFEGGVRVPFSMKWPAQIDAGGSFDHPVSSLDIFPTVVAAAGGDLSEAATLDGVNLLSYLDGSNESPPHETLFWRNGDNWAAREGHWKLIHAADQVWLYNLSEDIGERINVAAEHPEVVERMSATYSEWNSGNIDPLWPALGAKNLPEFSVDGVAIEWDL